MLKILNEKVLKSHSEIRNLYKDCKYVYIIDSYDKVVSDEGYLYCVSTSDDSYDALIRQLRNKFVILISTRQKPVIAGSLKEWMQKQDFRAWK